MLILAGGVMLAGGVCAVLQNSDLVYNTYVSYLEIYNENGYDLLDPQHEGAKLEDLP